jgi:hypothetical protein
MGHFTVLGGTIDQALNNALAVRQALGIGNYYVQAQNHRVQAWDLR